MQSKTSAREKLATFGGPGNDTSFEQAFSSIAHSYLQDVAPTLLDYELGFQLLDRNEDDTRAVGLIGFKIGSQYMYAPVFYIDNELKGHELLYVKNEDRFVPLKENWINYLMNKKPQMLGNGVSRNMSELGIRQPDYTRLRLPPNKIASARMADWVHGFLPCYGALHTNPTGALPAPPSLPEFLKKAGREMLVALVKTASTLPNVARGIEQFHGLKMLQDVWQEVKQAEAAKASLLIPRKQQRGLQKRGSLLNPTPSSVGQLKIHTKVGAQTSLLPLDLNDAQMEALWKVGVVIEDYRPETSISKLFKPQLRQTLTSPTRSGIYDVLVRDSDEEYGVEKCVVIKAPHTSAGPAGWVTVIRMDNKTWCNQPADSVYTSKQYPDKEWEDWVAALPAAEKFSPSRSVHLLVNKEGNGVSPFEVVRTIGGANGVQTYKVEFCDTHPWRGNELGGDITRPSSKSCCHDGNLQIDASTSGVTANGHEEMKPSARDDRRVRMLHDCLVVPDTFKHYTMHASDEMPYGYDRTESKTERAALRLGSLADVQTHLFKNAAALKVWSDGNEVEINGRRMAKLAGLVDLVQNIGLRETVANTVLHDAERSGTQHYYVKLADVYSDLQPGPGAPVIPEPQYGQQQMIYGGGVPAMEPQQTDVPVHDMLTPSENMSYYDPTVDMQSWQTAQDAAANGQQDVFDTATIGSLLKMHRDDSMIDEHLSDLMRGLDRCGRLLFLFYAHNDKFEDRYGKSEMPELEDSLRTTFENVGDLCLYLKQKTIEASPEDSFEVSLDGISPE